MDILVLPIKMREHRRRLIAMLALVTLLVVCVAFGQFILDGLSSWCAPRPGGTCR